MTELQNELHVKIFTPETRQADSNTVILALPCLALKLSVDYDEDAVLAEV